jgi:hypothetical protein
VTLDPLIARTIGIGLGLMFLLAAAHKLKHRADFHDTLHEYRLLPRPLLAPIAVLLPLAELFVGIAWLVAGDLQVIAALASAVLLGLYSAAIGINVARGRIHFDCGCSFGSESGKEQFLSYGLMLRNLVLLAAALLPLLPQASRTLHFTDFLILAAALLAIVLLFAAANQLFANGAAINTWRKRRA